MKHQHADYQVIPFPKYRQFAAAANQSIRYKSMIHGLIEVDVTKARSALRQHKATTGEMLSFTAFVATCLARAVDEHKEVQAFHQGGKRLVLFDDVDINTRIERDVAGQKYVIPYVIHAANHRTFRELHDEIRTVQEANMQEVLARFQLLMRLPPMIYRPFTWAILRIADRRPQLWKRLMGTVGLTSVGMFGHGAGWGIPASAPTALMVAVGGIGERQVMVDGQFVVREYLSLTISVDHDVVDGAPATRFTQRLKELIENGYGLDDILPEPERERVTHSEMNQQRQGSSHEAIQIA